MHQNYNWFNHKSSILHHWLMAQLVEHQIQKLKILRGRGFGSLWELCSKNGNFFYKLRTKIALSPEQRLACQRTLYALKSYISSIKIRSWIHIPHILQIRFQVHKNYFIESVTLFLATKSGEILEFWLEFSMWSVGSLFKFHICL